MCKKTEKQLNEAGMYTIYICMCRLCVKERGVVVYCFYLTNRSWRRKAMHYKDVSFVIAVRWRTVGVGKGRHHGH